MSYSRLKYIKYENDRKIIRYLGGIIKKVISTKSEKYYLFGVQFYKKRISTISKLPKLAEVIATFDAISEEERYITCFDCLYDSKQEAIDAYALYRYLKELKIPCKYILNKGNKLAKTLNDEDVILVSDKFDFITNHSDIIRKSKALVTSFGFGISLDKCFFNLDYLDYVFIEHGVIFLKKRRIMDRYNTQIFNRMIVPTRLTYDLYKNDPRYNKDALILSGIPRWDYLSNTGNKHIFVFFTWRKVFSENPKSAHKYIEYIESFVNNLAQILDNQFEIDVAAHHELGHIGCEGYHFDNSHIHLINTGNVSDLIRNSSMLITDYSSVAFDFMYQDKPVIFYKFDWNATYLNNIDLMNCIDAMIEDTKLYNCFYSEQEVCKKVRYYAEHDFILEDEFRKKNSQIFWDREHNCCAKLATALTEK
jgi:hypothetical protein